MLIVVHLNKQIIKSYKYLIGLLILMEEGKYTTGPLKEKGDELATPDTGDETYPIIDVNMCIKYVPHIFKSDYDKVI